MKTLKTFFIVERVDGGPEREPRYKQQQGAWRGGVCVCVCVGGCGGYERRLASFFIRADSV